MSAVDQSATVQQLEVATDGDLRARVLPGEFAHQGAAILIHEIHDGPAALFVQDGCSFDWHSAAYRIRSYSIRNEDEREKLTRKNNRNRGFARITRIRTRQQIKGNCG